MGWDSMLAGGDRTVMGWSATSGRPASQDEMVVDEKAACAVFGELLEESRVTSSGLCRGEIVEGAEEGRG